MNSQFTRLSLSALLLFSPLSAAAADFNPTALAAIQDTEKADSMQIRGVLKAKQTANIAAAMSARIIKAPYKSGQSFKRGALLIRFDCAQLLAEKSALEATRTVAELKHENIKELLLAGAAGELEATLAAADTHKANAEISVVRARLKDCQIHAPYAGIVQEKHVSAYDTPALNASLLTIMRKGAPEIKLIAPSAWLAWLTPGTPFEFTIDETRKSYPAKVLRTGASVDPVSQTIELTAAFKTSAQGALAGMSGIARFETASTNQEK